MTTAEWPVPLDARALRQRWTALCDRFEARSDPVDSVWQQIEGAYGAAHRRYHTLEHLGEVFALIDTICVAPPPAVELAAWLHDLVYDTARTDNEVASANWAVEHLPALGIDHAVVARTSDLVLMTAMHDPPDTDEAAATLSDADLAILGAPASRYRRYAVDVRAEYADLDDGTWRSGRTRVLQTLLARPRLYHHASLRTWETKAARNMSSELVALGT